MSVMLLLMVMVMGMVMVVTTVTTTTMITPLRIINAGMDHIERMLVSRDDNRNVPVCAASGCVNSWMIS